jgi:hypothetical protein
MWALRGSAPRVRGQAVCDIPRYMGDGVGGVRGWSTSEASLASSGESVVGTMCSTQTSADERRRLEEMQHVATQCNMLQPSAACCDPVQHVATQCKRLQPSATNPVQHVAELATQCNKPSATCCNTFCRREAEARSRPGNLSHGRVRDATCAAGTQWWPWMHPRWGVGSGTAAGRHRRGAEREPGAAERVPRRNGRPSQAPARAPRSAHGRSDQDGPNGTPRPKRCTHRPCEMNGRWGVRASVSSRAGGGRPGEGRRASEQAAARRTGHIQTSPCKSPTTSSSAGATSLPAAPRPAARSSASCMRAERSRLCRLDRCTARNRPPA